MRNFIKTYMEKKLYRHYKRKDTNLEFISQFKGFNPFEMDYKINNFNIKTLNYYDSILINLKSKTLNLNETFSKDELLELNDILTMFSNEVYIVGGAIRDILCKNPKTPKDYDFVVDTFEDIEALKQTFIKMGYFVKEVGQHFGVLMVSKNHKTYEIAMFRKDIYDDEKSKGADRVEKGTLIDDSNRRDFTINSLYYNLNTQEILDPTKQGIKDILSNELNFVGKCDNRIKEDSIRLLRLLKFHKRGFDLSKKSLRAFRRNFELLCKANPDRIREHIELLADIKG